MRTRRSESARRSERGAVCACGRTWRVGAGLELTSTGQTLDVTGRLPHPFPVQPVPPGGRDGVGPRSHRGAGAFEVSWYARARRVESTCSCSRAGVHQRPAGTWPHGSSSPSPTPTTPRPSRRRDRQRERRRGRRDGGVDVSYLVTKQVGIGGGARYSYASATLKSSAQPTEVGLAALQGGVRRPHPVLMGDAPVATTPFTVRVLNRGPPHPAWPGLHLWRCCRARGPAPRVAGRRQHHARLRCAGHALPSRRGGGRPARRLRRKPGHETGVLIAEGVTVAAAASGVAPRPLAGPGTGSTLTEPPQRQSPYPRGDDLRKDSRLAGQPIMAMTPSDRTEAHRLDRDVVQRCRRGELGAIRGALQAVWQPALHGGLPDDGQRRRRGGPRAGHLPPGLPAPRQLPRRGRARTWLHRLAVNACLDFVRSKQADASGDRRGRGSRRARSARHGTVAADAALDRLDLERAIAQLPPSYRRAFLLHDVEGLEHHEIGETLGIAEGTSKSLLFKARTRLRFALRGRAYAGAAQPARATVCRHRGRRHGEG